MKKIAIVVAVVFAALVLPVSSAFAAGTGYQGNTGPAGVPGGFSTVITTQTVQSGGGTVTGTVGAYNVTIIVPSGAFTQAEQVTLTSGDTGGVGSAGVSGDSAVVGIGINVSDPNTGAKFTGSFPTASPLSVTIAGTFNTSDTVVFYNTGTSTWAPLTGATITGSQVTFNITTDPDIAVLSSVATTSPTAPVSGATTDATGKPFLLEEIIAGALVLFGLAALIWIRRRRPSTRQG